MENKQKIEDFDVNIDIYIDILTVGIDSAENFASILCLRYFFQIFTCLNIIQMKSEVNIKI